MSKKSANAVHDITVKNLLEANRLPDGDKILLVEQTNGIQGRIEFTLLVNADNWWKGLLLFTKDGSNTYTAVAEVQDENGRSSGTVTHKDVTNQDLVLSKGKFGGVHTNMYNIVDAADFFTEGKSYLLRWMQA